MNCLGCFLISHIRNGRWQSSYTVDTKSKKVTGEIKVLVHYYEDGNVQLNATKAIDFEITGSMVKKKARSCNLLTNLSPLIVAYHPP